MTDIGRLSFAIDSTQFTRALREMRVELGKFQREAAQAGKAAGGIGVGASGAGGTIGTNGAAGGGVALGAAAGRIGSRGFGGRAAGGFAGAALGGVGLRGLGAAGVGFAGFSAIRGTIRAAADLEQGIAQVAAITGASADEMERLEAAARAAGASTQFTAGQSAGGLLELARAGLDAASAMEALEPTLDLATAGLLGMSEAADLATNVAAQFQLPASEIQRIGDVLVATANRSNTTVAQLGEGMKDVGVVASALGISLEDTSAALGTLANFGLKGSNAAIKLRQALLQLTDPSAGARSELERLGLSLEDVNIQQIGFQRVLANLGNAGLDISGASRLVGARNAAALAALARGGGGAQASLARQLDDADGEMSKLATTLENTTQGQVKQFASAMESLGLALSESTGLASGFTSVIQGMTDAARFASDTLSFFSNSQLSGPEWLQAWLTGSLDEARAEDRRRQQLEFESNALSRANALVSDGRPIARSPSPTASMQAESDAILRFERSLRQDIRRFERSPAMWAATMDDADLQRITGTSFGAQQAQRQAQARQMAAFQSQQTALESSRRSPAMMGYGPGQFVNDRLAGSIAAGEQRNQQRLDSVVGALDAEAGALRQSRQEREAYWAAMQAVVPLRSAEGEAIRQQVEELQRLERMDVLSEGIGQGITDIGSSWLFAADSAEDATRRILESMSQLAVQQFALQPLSDALSAFAGGIFKGTGDTGRGAPLGGTPGRG